jgi:exonuclease III
MQLMYRSSWRFALWNVQGIQSRPSHTLVSNFLNSLHVNAAVLTETNLSSSPNPPWRHWPATHWATTAPSRGSGVAVVASPDIKILSFRDSGDGRLIEATLELGSTRINLVAVYTPADAKRRTHG